MATSIQNFIGLSCLAVLLCAWRLHGQAIGPWRTGSATYYGTDNWSIHVGSCGYGYLFNDEPLGWDVAAMTDYDPDYVNSCGLCFEVACNPANITDGYGANFDRTKACYDASASLVVRITDVCPCIYPPNAYSNKRWCCASDTRPHLDMSMWAYEKLAAAHWGVIAVKYRAVPCTYQPANVAPTPVNSTAMDPPPATAFRKVRDWPEYWPTGASPLAMLTNGQASNGWTDASYGVTMMQPGSGPVGIRGQASFCATVAPKGAVSLLASPGSGGFTNRISLALWVFVGENDATHVVPPATIVAGGPKGDCLSIQLSSIVPTAFAPTCQYCTQQWWRYVVPLSALAGQGVNSVINNDQYFRGCGGNSAAELNFLDLRNFNQDPMTVCLADVLLK